MENSAKRGAALFEVIRALVIGIILSLGLVLLAALIIKLFNLPNGAIPVINQVIKGVSILLGCLLSLKNRQNNWLKGMIVGVSYIVLSYIVFSLLDGAFAFGVHLLNDFVLGAVTGLVSGIITGLKKHA